MEKKIYQDYPEIITKFLKYKRPQSAPRTKAANASSTPSALALELWIRILPLTPAISTQVACIKLLLKKWLKTDCACPQLQSIKTCIWDKGAHFSVAILTLGEAVITASSSTLRDIRCEKLHGLAHSRRCSVCQPGVERLEQQLNMNQEKPKQIQLK